MSIYLKKLSAETYQAIKETALKKGWEDIYEWMEPTCRDSGLNIITWVNSYGETTKIGCTSKEELP